MFLLKGDSRFLAHKASALQLDHINLREELLQQLLEKLVIAEIYRHRVIL